MKSGDSQANNLFSRLLSYTPQEEWQTPLENFCTESLAWCLKVSPKFRTKFLNLVRDGLLKKEKLFPTDFDKSLVEIHTQFGFRDEEELDRGQSFQDCKAKFLASLTKWREIPENGLDAIIFWPDVLEKLRETVSEDENPQSNDKHLSAASFMLEQFADFLKKKHVTPMKIDTINPEDLKNWTNFFKFQAASLDILERFREEQKTIWKPKQIEIDYSLNDDDSFFWWGVYSRIHDSDWCGFVFFYAKNPPELVMQIEGRFVKGTKLHQIKPYLGEGLAKAIQTTNDKAPDSTWFMFQQPIYPDYSGKAEAMYGWLASASKEFSKLRKNLVR